MMEAEIKEMKQFEYPPGKMLVKKKKKKKETKRKTMNKKIPIPGIYDLRMDI